MKSIIEENLERKMKEIEKLHQQFKDIYSDKNIFVKWLNSSKARKLLNLSKKKLQELLKGNLD